MEREYFKKFVPSFERTDIAAVEALFIEKGWECWTGQPTNGGTNLYFALQVSESRTVLKDYVEGGHLHFYVDWPYEDLFEEFSATRAGVTLTPIEGKNRQEYRVEPKGADRGVTYRFLDDWEKFRKMRSMAADRGP
jgi:hypothetical protein